jgi:hypothetical protein
LKRFPPAQAELVEAGELRTLQSGFDKLSLSGSIKLNATLA